MLWALSLAAEGFELRCCSALIYTRVVTYLPADSALTHFDLQGEVWQLLKNKLSVAPMDGYCCLVAEDATRPAGVLGTVEVSLQSEQVQPFFVKVQVKCVALLRPGVSWLTQHDFLCPALTASQSQDSNLKISPALACPDCLTNLGSE